jgi:hypothetical protein
MIGSLQMSAQSKIDYEVISLVDVPFRFPVAKPPINPKGSQWDEILTVLKRERGKAVKIVEPDKEKRNKLKSTLQTMAKNRFLFVKVRERDSAVYAYRSDEEGRFARPEE